MTGEPHLLCSVEDGVGIVTFNRPERNNAFTPEMNQMFDDAMIRLEQDQDVRAVVITGTGEGFCVGSDMVSLKQSSEKGTSEGFPHPERPFAKYDVFRDAPPELRSRFVLPKAMSKPVIAAVNGRCAGIGLSMAVSSDVRFASSDAMFSAVFARRGLTAETGIAWLLVELIGTGATADMLLSGRRVFAEEARTMGLVNHVVPRDELMPRALEYARDIAVNVSPNSTRVIKRQIWKAQRQTFMEAAILAYLEAGRSLKTADFREGIAHFIERRAPRFTGQ
ncbi:enoyl-CoA hydratase-related protein [Sphingobium sp. Sx8-8]|uniref:enoyl-CoA hydratase-related protein n=1 Tax=Sphingobium sp. Sx8-8 TaxID=2933617 RepID=UPI001F5AD4AD|nr:enoyl-CoA hydratase-related protein [Sphingobium sp. Sx8-8]